MKGISIDDRDDRNVLTFDLSDVLHVVGEKAKRSIWKVENVEAFGGDEAEALMQLADTSSEIDGTRFIDLAESIDQVIDGVFKAFCNGDELPWLVVYAVDSSAFDVVTDDEEVLLGLRLRFKSVQDIPS